MRSIRRDTQFKRDVKRLKKRHKDFEKLKTIIQLLVAGERLPPGTRDHRLKGILKDCRECRIEPDWLLIYRIDGSEQCLVRTGSHADLFEWKIGFVDNLNPHGTVPKLCPSLRKAGLKWCKAKYYILWYTKEPKNCNNSSKTKYHPAADTLRKFELSKKSESMQVSNEYHRLVYGLEAFGLGSGDRLTVFGYKVTFNVAVNDSGN